MVGQNMTHEALGRLAEQRDRLARQLADDLVEGVEPALYKVASYAAVKATMDAELRATA